MGALGFNVFIITILCFMLWNSAMAQVGAAKAGFYRYFTPVAAVVVGYLLYREPIHAGQIAGACLMFIGLVGISTKERSLL